MNTFLKYFRQILYGALFMAVLSGCATKPTTPPTLFERMGGLPVIKVVVHETIDQVAHDPKSMRSFQHIKLPKLEESIVAQLCLLTGGGCVYEGETMLNAHKDAKITDAEFELMVTALRESLDRHVGTREKNELLRILAPMKRDIVTPA